jgi:two-component system, sensor histidine kinase and response regulator
LSPSTVNEAGTGGLAQKLTLLIVDDEEGPRQSLRIVFKNDYHVLVASSPLEAVEIAQRQPVHIAVLDILMQGMSGVELLRELKEINPDIEVVMLTAYETIETARQALRHGASDYLNKPFDIPTMRAAVARAAQKHLTTSEFRRSNDLLSELQRVIEEQRVKEEMARTKGEIYASVLHDLNSPLTVISGFIELINRAMEDAARVEGEQLETLKGDLRQLTGQVGRCFEISRRYLSFLNKGAAEASYANVRQILADLKDLLARHPCAQGHQLVVEEAPSNFVAAMNGTDLLQVLLNLTINALQATARPHRVEVEARRQSQPVDFAVIHDGEAERFINRDGFVNRAPLLAITVRDSGPGIPPEFVAKMFEQPFTTKPADMGTGLGLSIIRRLIVSANAAIHFRTAVGEGTEFTVFLPAAE